MKTIKIHILDDNHPDYAICGDVAEGYDSNARGLIVFHQCQNCVIVFAGTQDAIKT